ncbi:hypothetical protein RB623_24425 [Mesorhizobium sp. LHD-90]|uniref:hypothetical protein n=1 Tax=Mesorhizobium sp. LHD-90 TaxID=3071414 RepID=UPI0027E0ADDA|nr:hypothetical protein [Mesorhizobium sp. LHD-90]MDQ6437211.1 hypothetical protein [Mesorhizobium sp. LHD-90]
MTLGSKLTGREGGFSAAARRFPQAEFAIRKLMNRSEAFRDICEELAEAEWALASVPETPAALHEARRTEWQDLVDRLAAELATALREGQAAQNRTGNDC